MTLLETSNSPSRLSLESKLNEDGELERVSKPWYILECIECAGMNVMTLFTCSTIQISY